eukprot:GEMP01006590.1.p1 GENE.GEMP01006590.1~~GEMP01006590.1.p1  ORF type:complete len:512 (+),score=181.66 GEMP01006590.1:203-1738(+)
MEEFTQRFNGSSSETCVNFYLEKFRQTLSTTNTPSTNTGVVPAAEEEGEWEEGEEGEGDGEWVEEEGEGEGEGEGEWEEGTVEEYAGDGAEGGGAAEEPVVAQGEERPVDEDIGVNAGAACQASSQSGEGSVEVYKPGGVHGAAPLPPRPVIPLIPIAEAPPAWGNSVENQVGYNNIAYRGAPVWNEWSTEEYWVGDWNEWNPWGEWGEWNAPYWGQGWEPQPQPQGPYWDTYQQCWMEPVWETTAQPGVIGAPIGGATGAEPAEFLEMVAGGPHVELPENVVEAAKEEGEDTEKDKDTEKGTEKDNEKDKEAKEGEGEEEKEGEEGEEGEGEENKRPLPCDDEEDAERKRPKLDDEKDQSEEEFDEARARSDDEVACEGAVKVTFGSAEHRTALIAELERWAPSTISKNRHKEQCSVDHCEREWYSSDLATGDGSLNKYVEHYIIAHILQDVDREMNEDINVPTDGKCRFVLVLGQCDMCCGKVTGLYEWNDNYHFRRLCNQCHALRSKK